MTWKHIFAISKKWKHNFAMLLSVLHGFSLGYPQVELPVIAKFQ